MNLFKNYTFTWKQIGIFKLALLSIGVIIGSVWYQFFGDNIAIVVIVAIISTGYIMYVSLKQ
jgi:putative Mn2+ efflux pump MntP